MTKVDEEQQQTMITEMSPRQMGQLLLAGFVAGIIAGGLTLLFSVYLFKVMPCSGEACGTGGQYAAVLAGIISGAAALFWLMRIQVFRPLLVIIAVTISLWGIELYILHWPWYLVILTSAILHTGAYGLFTWISRIRLFWIVLLLLLIAVVGVRFILAG